MMTETKGLVWPDYENCIANLPNSILKSWKLPTVGKTLALADQYVEKEYKNVVVFLLDGMGKHILEKMLSENGFFRSHLAGIYQSVFLSTTVAATTSVLSGLQPCEHCWLGWDCYYPQLDQNVTVFRNTIQNTQEPAADYNVAWTLTPYADIVSKIQKAGGKAYSCAPFFPPFPKSLDEICAQVKALCREPEHKFIYAYWDQPDDCLHRCGSGSEQVKETLLQIEETLRTLAGELEDTLLFITADHGHIDTEYVLLQDYPQICDCLVRLPSLEPRALNFFVQEGKKEIFAREFQKAFGDKFLLLTKEEVIARGLFGNGTPHALFASMLGDYLAVATGNLSIYFDDDRWLSMHGGLTKEEMLIPLIVCE